jgi:hypothetical protein
MNAQTALDLTRIMQAEGIQRIYMSADGRSFSVALHGGYYATGKSVGEAFEQALRDREARQSERLAA